MANRKQLIGGAVAILAFLGGCTKIPPQAPVAAAPDPVFDRAYGDAMKQVFSDARIACAAPHRSDRTMSECQRRDAIRSNLPATPTN